MSWLARSRFAPLRRSTISRFSHFASENEIVIDARELIALLKKRWEKLDEEAIPRYKPEHFYPAKLGETVNNTYQLVSKLGFGMTSTVWLARDTRRWWWQKNRYVSLKICVNNYPAEFMENEMTLSQRISTANPSHPGRQFLRPATDTFRIQGPDGVHPVLVYEAMREPIEMLQMRIGGSFAPDLLKTTLGFILTGLDYLHSECNIVHTDLKLDNILIPFESSSLPHKIAREESKRPYPRKTLPDGRIIYLSRRNVGDLMPRKPMGPPRISDFGAAVQLTNNNKEHPTFRIQPASYVAPEVCLGAPWGYSADIWNLGLLMWELLEGKSLFESIDPEYKKRTERTQLADIVSLLGPPPGSLLSRGSKSHLFFDPLGRFKFKDILPQTKSLESTITVLKGRNKDLFMDFARGMLTWIPEERKTAQELLNHPWLIQP